MGDGYGEGAVTSQLFERIEDLQSRPPKILIIARNDAAVVSGFERVGRYVRVNLWSTNRRNPALRGTDGI